jgi:hypothetical protein
MLYIQLSSSEANMLWILVIVTVLHVLPGMFWAGSTAVMARSGAAGIEGLAFAQIGAATTAIIMGAVLWGINHHGGEGTGEHVLAAGAFCALAAVAVQAISLPRVRRLIRAADTEKPALRGTLAFNQRIASVLLVITIACMVVWRYF